MKKARNLRRELDTWKLAWQQVDAFLERIDGMRDQDEPFAKRCLALLTTARVIEHQRAFFFSDKPLSDPMVDRLPAGVSDANLAWGNSYRLWRIPGSDELELAAANLYITPTGELLEAIVLAGGKDLLLEQRVEEDDPRYADSDNGLIEVELPSYPGIEHEQAIVPNNGNLTVVIASDGAAGDSVISLFSKAQREAATLGEVDDEEEPLQSWSELCRARREYREDADDSEVNYVGASGDLPWSRSHRDDALTVIAHVRDGTVPAVGEPSDVELLNGVIAAANASAAWLSTDATDLQQAADTLEEEGTMELTLPSEVREAVNELAGQQDGFSNVATLAGDLLALLTLTTQGPAVSASTQTQRQDKANELEAAVLAVSTLEPSNSLLRTEPEENSRIADELDNAFGARLAYPDGSLRLLRALESMFLATWPSRRRWFSRRHAQVLRPLFSAFRRPFIQGLRALLQGGSTGLPDDVSLTLATNVPVGAVSLPIDQPASLQGGIRRIETGQLAMIDGDRPAAAVVLGLDKEAGKLKLNIAPLRVSTATEPPGSSGLVLAGTDLGSVAGPLSRDELRLGESAAGAAADGPVHEAVALWSRLALVFGWQAIEEELQNGLSIEEDDYALRLIPEPSDTLLHDVRFYGRVEANTLTIAIRGLGEDFWHRLPDEPPLPLVARPGELLLLRGRAEPSEEGATGPLVQAVVEVDAVYHTTGAMLARMDKSQLAQLSITPLSDEETDNCQMMCRPQEDIAMLVLRQTWLRDKHLIDRIYLGRDFAGFDNPSLATETLLPSELVGVITGKTPDDGGYDRSAEYLAAQQQLAAWTRFAR